MGRIPTLRAPNPPIARNLFASKTYTKIVRKWGVFVKRKYPEATGG